MLFTKRHPEVDNFSGTFDFGLSGDDGLRLYDNQGILVTSVIYNSVDPWPVSPSGSSVNVACQKKTITKSSSLCSFWMSIWRTRSRSPERRAAATHAG